MAETEASASKAGQDEPQWVEIFVVETQPFTRAAKKLLSEAEKKQLKEEVAQIRELGNLIPGTGGLRKFRWARDNNKGKRGGARVIYYYMDDEVPLYLMGVYAKNEKETLSAKEKKEARAAIAAIKSDLTDPVKRRAHLRVIEGSKATSKVSVKVESFKR